MTNTNLAEQKLREVEKALDAWQKQIIGERTASCGIQSESASGICRKVDSLNEATRRAKDAPNEVSLLSTRRPINAFGRHATISAIADLVGTAFTKEGGAVRSCRIERAV